MQFTTFYSEMHGHDHKILKRTKKWITYLEHSKKNAIRFSLQLCLHHTECQYMKQSISFIPQTASADLCFITVTKSVSWHYSSWHIKYLLHVIDHPMLTEHFTNNIFLPQYITSFARNAMKIWWHIDWATVIQRKQIQYILILKENNILRMKSNKQMIINSVCSKSSKLFLM